MKGPVNFLKEENTFCNTVNILFSFYILFLLVLSERKKVCSFPQGPELTLHQLDNLNTGNVLSDFFSSLFTSAYKLDISDYSFSEILHHRNVNFVFFSMSTALCPRVPVSGETEELRHQTLDIISPPSDPWPLTH